MLANTADTGSLEYNTADATLWFIHAVGRHVATTGDLDLAAELADDLEAIVEHHIRGTRYGIAIDAPMASSPRASPAWLLRGWMLASTNPR